MKTVTEYARMFWGMGEIPNKPQDRKNLEAVISLAMRAAAKQARQDPDWFEMIPIICPSRGWPSEQPEKPLFTKLSDVTTEQEFVIPPPNCHPNDIKNLDAYKLCYHDTGWGDWERKKVWIYSIKGGNVKCLPGDTQVGIVHKGD